MRRLFLAALGSLFAVGFAAAADTEIKLADFKVAAKGKDAPAELVGFNDGEGKIFMYVVATATAEFEAKEEGVHKFKLEISGDMAKKDHAKFKLTIGGKEIEKEFELKQNDAKVYTFKADLKKGKQKIEIEFLNDEYKEGEYDCNLYIHSVKFDKTDEKLDEKKPEEKKPETKTEKADK